MADYAGPDLGLVARRRSRESETSHERRLANEEDGPGYAGTRGQCARLDTAESGVGRRAIHSHARGWELLLQPRSVGVSETALVQHSPRRRQPGRTDHWC